MDLQWTEVSIVHNVDFSSNAIDHVATKFQELHLCEIKLFSVHLKYY